MSILVHKQEGFPITKAQENQLLPEKESVPCSVFLCP